MIVLQNFSTGPDKDTFHRYLNKFGATDNEAELFDSLSDCTDMLPNSDAEKLGLPIGSTYREAVRLLLSAWSTTLRAPGQHSFDDLP